MPSTLFNVTLSILPLPDNDASSFKLTSPLTLFTLNSSFVLPFCRSISDFWPLVTAIVSPVILTPVVFWSSYSALNDNESSSDKSLNDKLPDSTTILLFETSSKLTFPFV